MKGYDVKVRLDDFRPLTWRDLIIPENITFHQLHLIMQKLWNFYDMHLYEFTTTDYRTKFIDFDRMSMDTEYIPDYGEQNSKTVYINDIFDSNKKIKYCYDFGDSWSFTIEIKKKIDYDNTYPNIKRFKGEYNPVEDCGGTWGLSDLIELAEKDEEDERGFVDELEKFDQEKIREELINTCNFKSEKTVSTKDEEISAEYDFIIRDDGLPVFYEADDSYAFDTFAFLENDYNYILESINEEGFKIENPSCHIFKEILYDDKVVGFSTYETMNCVDEVSLNCIYVLPEFRGKQLFITEMKEMLEEFTVGIFEPTRFIIELLIKYGFAKRLTDNLVASGINLDIPPTSFSCNKITYHIDEDNLYSSNLYDTNICATIDLENISSPKTNIIFYSRMLKDDMERYDCKSKRLDLNKKYFDNIKNVMINNSDEFIPIIQELKEDVDDINHFNKLTPEENKKYLLEMVGQKGQLSEMFESMIERNILTYERAYEVQSQIIDEIHEDIVTFEGLANRITFLSNKEEIEKSLKLIDMFNPHSENICPYCQMDLDNSQGFCNFCGYNLSHKPRADDERFTTDRDTDVVQFLLQKISEDFYGNPVVINKNYEEDYVFYLDGRYCEDTDESALKLAIMVSLEHLTSEPMFETMMRVSDIFGVDDEDLIDYMMDNELIGDDVNQKSWTNYASTLTVSKLKNILKSSNLKVSGNKSELIDRIYENLDVEDIMDDLIDDFLCCVSDKGYNYLEKHEYTNYYRRYLRKLSFTEFEEHYDSNIGIIDSILSFLDLHEKNAIETTNQKQYVNALEIKRLIMSCNNMDEERAINEITIFNIFLNPMEYTSYNVKGEINRFNTENVRELRKLKKADKIELNMLKPVYDNIQHKPYFSYEKTEKALEMVLDNIPVSEVREMLDDK